MDLLGTLAHIKRTVDLVVDGFKHFLERLTTMDTQIKALSDQVSALSNALVARESAASDFRSKVLTFIADVKVALANAGTGGGLTAEDRQALSDASANLQSFAAQAGISAQSDADVVAQIPSLLSPSPSTGGGSASSAASSPTSSASSAPTPPKGVGVVSDSGEVDLTKHAE